MTDNRVKASRAYNKLKELHNKDSQKELECKHREDLEEVLSKDEVYAYLYAKNILRSRFFSGEEIISRNPWMAVIYAEEVINGRFEEAEPSILSERGKIREDYIKFLRGDTVVYDL
jgi:hypothetical protein